MDLNVTHYPNKTFALFSWTPSFCVDINRSVRAKLRTGEQLTHEKALEIFKQIKWESDALSFLAKSIVLIPLSLAIITAGFLIPPFSLDLLVIGALVCGLGGGILGFSIENTWNGFLPELSQAYSEQRQRASEYIQMLEVSTQEVTLVLA